MLGKKVGQEGFKSLALPQWVHNRYMVMLSIPSGSRQLEVALFVDYRSRSASIGWTAALRAVFRFVPSKIFPHNRGCRFSFGDGIIPIVDFWKVKWGSAVQKRQSVPLSWLEALGEQSKQCSIHQQHKRNEHQNWSRVFECIGADTFCLLPEHGIAGRKKKIRLKKKKWSSCCFCIKHHFIIVDFKFHLRVHRWIVVPPPNFMGETSSEFIFCNGFILTVMGYCPFNSFKTASKIAGKELSKSTHEGAVYRPGKCKVGCFQFGHNFRRNF